MDVAQLLVIGIPTLAVLLGVLAGNSGVANLRAAIQSNHADVLHSLAGLRDVMDARFAEQRAELLRVAYEFAGDGKR